MSFEGIPGVSEPTSTVSYPYRASYSANCRIDPKIDGSAPESTSSCDAASTVTEELWERTPPG